MIELGKEWVLKNYEKFKLKKPARMSSLVLKFGGTSVGSIKAISFVAEKIKKLKKNGARLVVIVSAMSGETNRLFGNGKRI